ncbi:MAG: bifunctional [glutamine synthetase] adenylyltransferase/[glutamine synthetase]-adenylyl-L-tyrosine phosphorylase [Rhizobiales bacterium]|nr:bifunctional [glutamine synthetase] adenylyltransferase/[glutamine synthetase]-adenylyl-L-tyrosine phosphorylase [Hyphomicrobiales bacterium]NRB13372.1 bifunctional [glutamine synthetase] adenylyltransferase/[glutamine synthetase]-adenylyl-L-tyrosine phosphorylase [Hyphomicrobiales bacterium]
MTLETSEFVQFPPAMDEEKAETKYADLKQLFADNNFDYEFLNHNQQLESLLKIILVSSPYLSSIIVKFPQFTLDILRQKTDIIFKIFKADLDVKINAASNEDELMMHLRIGKQKLALCLAIWDLQGQLPQAKITDILSRFADYSIEVSLKYILKQLVAEGKIETDNIDAISRHCGLFVIAMGKHGAFELNYSSDIDLIVFFDPNKLNLADGKDPYKFAIKLTKKLVKYIQQRNEYGYVFRVDLRLRPDPGATQIAISYDAALSYYESIGQNWERAAMIKARICAGDQKLGQDFMQQLQPFIWRKYLDFASIRDVHAMKRQIHIHKGHGEIKVDGHNIKLGRGGIREIEFFVQTQQLIAGGRQPELRKSGTLEMLDSLTQAKWILPQVAVDLKECYIFLRNVEHRLQMLNDEQTQTLPTDLPKLENFARFCAYNNLESFRQDMLRHLNKVQEHYAALFENAPQLNAELGNLVFTGAEHDEETLTTLSRLGYEFPSRTSDMVRQWHFARYPCLRTSRTRSLVTEMVPTILQQLSKASNPDNALLAFDRFLMGLPAGVQLFSLFINNADLFNLFVNILITAPKLASQLSHKSQLFDAVINPSFMQDLPTKLQYQLALAKAMQAVDDFEGRLNVARIFGQEAQFQIGVHQISQITRGDEIALAYSDLADCLVATMLDVAKQEIARRFGEIDGELVVVGMGKLGSQELTCTSDLDLIVIYDVADEHVVSNGKKSLNSTLWFTKLTQSLISALTVPTTEGALFEVDMRLRPSGKKGPVATRFESFENYQQNQAWVWEHQALTRARVVAGDKKLAAKVEATIRRTLAQQRDEQKIKAEVLEMRGRINAEKKTDNIWSVKPIKGGIIDIEFIIQYLSLIHAQKTPEILQINSLKSLQYIFENQYISAEQYENLSISLKLYSEISQIIRVTIDGDFEAETIPDGLERLLLAVTNSPDIKYLEQTLRELQAKTSKIFTEFIGAYE